ncbi:MAG: NAD-dependent epimerase/dehydratase family protein [Clostridia bacterium]|nr:NAD-dependent epimerase/dehydratase family protein [Clostridia bacterium]
MKNYSENKKVLITGANSYIGMSFENWAKEHYGESITVDTLDMLDENWREKDFSPYDAVYHVAGIAHADVGHVSEETKELYYKVNRDLAVETAEKAKKEGIKQFIFMSSLIIYGESEKYGRDKTITKDTEPEPANFYGDSKWQADKKLRELQEDGFNIAIIRPPMIYGEGCKGNYAALKKMAMKLPVFPKVKNERSMLNIDRLCEFLCNLILSGEAGIFFPQDPEYGCTSEIVKRIAAENNHKIFVSKIFAPFVFLASKCPGKIGGLTNKAFGNMKYDMELSKHDFGE